MALQISHIGLKPMNNKRKLNTKVNQHWCCCIKVGLQMDLLLL
jgi:hypothetical protein